MVGPLHKTVLRYFPDGIARSGPTFKVTVFVSGRGAIFAFVDIVTSKFLWVFGEIILAGLLRNSMIFGKNIHTASITAIAATSGVAIDEHLRGEGDIWPGSISGDVDSIGEGAGAALGPATAAVVRDVLVFVPGEIVDATDVAPVPALREVVGV